MKPSKISDDIYLLMHILVALRNNSRICFKAFVSFLLPLLKRKMSSMDNKRVIYKLTTTYTPFMSPLLLDSSINWLRPSAARRKRRGERGHPCCSPLWLWKKGVAAPLIKIAKLILFKHPMTQFINPMLNPKWVNNIHMYNRWCDHML